MQQTNAKGFSIVAVILVIAVLVALAFGAWFVWQKNQDDAKDNNKSSQNGNSNQPNNNQNEPADPSEGGKYLVITEWGVRFPLPEELRGDISYFVDNKAAKDFGGPVKIAFVSNAFDKGDLKCSVKDNHPRVLLSIFQQSDSEGVETTSPQPFKQLGDTRYYNAGGSCEEAISRDGSSDDKELLSSLKNAVSNLENVE